MEEPVDRRNPYEPPAADLKRSAALWRPKHRSWLVPLAASLLFFPLAWGLLGTTGLVFGALGAAGVATLVWRHNRKMARRLEQLADE